MALGQMILDQYGLAGDTKASGNTFDLMGKVPGVVELTFDDQGVKLLLGIVIVFAKIDDQLAQQIILAIDGQQPRAQVKRGQLGTQDRQPGPSSDPRSAAS